MADKFPMTPAGNAWMKKQLNKLKNIDRPANARARPSPTRPAPTTTTSKSSELMIALDGPNALTF